VRSALTRICSISDNAPDRPIFQVYDFIAFFLIALSGVIGRYFIPITLSCIIKHLFLLVYFRRRYRRYRR
jgi:hypothetical protein